jgi:hypothetical protein
MGRAPEGTLAEVRSAQSPRYHLDVLRILKASKCFLIDKISVCGLCK